MLTAPRYKTKQLNSKSQQKFNPHWKYCSAH